MIWMAGAVAHFGVANSPSASEAGSAVSYQRAQSAALLAALWGLLAWREFRGSGFPAKVLLALVFICLGGAIAASYEA